MLGLGLELGLALALALTLTLTMHRRPLISSLRRRTRFCAGFLRVLRPPTPLETPE